MIAVEVVPNITNEIARGAAEALVWDEAELARAVALSLAEGQRGVCRNVPHVKRV